MSRLTRLYTRKGDDGTTGLGSGTRVPKDSARVEAYGTVDELNSVLGVAVSEGLDEKLAAKATTIQNELFHVGADLCIPEEDKAEMALPQIGQGHVESLESFIDELNEVVGPVEDFILPGGAPGAARLQVARAVCRRAERRVITLRDNEKVSKWVIPYLNRLSDALFAMARYENHVRDVDEPLWDKLA